MQNCKRIKLVIWDLDETVWDGSLAERDTVRVYPDVKRIIKELSYHGIVNSVCSNNDYQRAKNELIKNDIWDYIVFANINYEPKGQRVFDIINNMNLREENVIYVDDNYLMIEEVKYYCPHINIINSYNINEILENGTLREYEDLELKRLNQYKQMEKRCDSRKKHKNNLEFLQSIHIKVKFIDYKPYLLTRISELVERTNQLNYTKNRMNKGQLQELLCSPEIECRCVWVKDDFGDNGIVGFYAKKGNELIHFVFSCRILHMGIDQWVYTKIGEPELIIAGEVAGKLKDGLPLADYITEIVNQSDVLDEKLMLQYYIEQTQKMTIYAIGACDLYRMIGDLATPNADITFDCNVFQGLNRSVNVGTEYIRSSYEMSKKEKEYCRKYFSNYSGKLVFNSRLLEKVYDYAVFTFHDDFSYFIYEHKKHKNLRIIRLKESIFDDDGKIMLLENEKQWLKDNFNPPHLITPERFYENLLWIRKKLPQHTKMVLVNGPTLDFYYSNNEHNEELHDQIIALNHVIDKFASEKTNNAKCVDVNKYIKSRADVWDYLFHWTTETSAMITLETLKVMSEFVNCREKNRAVDNITKGRKIILIGDNMFTSFCFYSLLANGYDVEGILALKEIEFKGKSIIENYNGEKRKRFLLISDSTKYLDIQEQLKKYGYKELEDYLFLQPSDYVKNWNIRQ